MAILSQHNTLGPIMDANRLPLAVDLDGTLLHIDTLYELFALALFRVPVQALLALFELRYGIAAFKRRLCDMAALDWTLLPARDALVEYLAEEAAAGREVHLVSAADQQIVSKIAKRFPFIQSSIGSGDGVNLKGHAKARKLCERFPGGFVYAGDSGADLPVWRECKAAIIVSSRRSLVAAVHGSGVPIERIFDGSVSPTRAWIEALRPHQWAKNAIVLVPLLLSWNAVTVSSLMTALVFIAILCAVASLTYLINDIADLASDRAHWSKRHRPFASGAIPVRDGLAAVGAFLPILCFAAFMLSPHAGMCVLFYVVTTLGYSFAWKRIPIFDTFIIGLLFTTRILIGMAAAQLAPSAWLLTFSMFFFLSLALAKRHTEILRAIEHGLQTLVGRGYQASDAGLTMTFGVSASMTSIVIVVLYLVEEVFSREIYQSPAWLWVAPIAIFLFTTRVWVLSHRGRMMDDPVAFALRDRVSLGLGVLVALAIALAI
ncbi:UbiA family prenyltransferase [Rhodopseudomonas palustris]|uniref:UbiA family prenyltransferase n=1 Tax=Rhodopseudomonas palustris TaxID=1076 RepID=UPI0021F2946E|nr:UbiA family prenyltransferase [Rhodopseudomonas palustris]UYO53116.1 UbiA family prenyltransferase [Rhodopseudomonas palustris]